MRIEPSNDKFPTAMEALKDSVGKRATMNCMVNGPGTKERYTFKGELMHIPNDILEFCGHGVPTNGDVDSAFWCG